MNRKFDLYITNPLPDPPPGKEVCERLEEYIKTGKITVEAHAFYTSPLPFWFVLCEYLYLLLLFSVRIRSCLSHGCLQWLIGSLFSCVLSISTRPYVLELCGLPAKGIYHWNSKTSILLKPWSLSKEMVKYYQFFNVIS
jgi:hypothetical protein